MKITKPKELSLLIRSFGIEQQTYLSCTILVYFDLQDPAQLCKEQDLWKTLPNLLGPGLALDEGMPKPRGEFLVTGSCFAPRGTTVPASEVRVRVGEVEKRLLVFGDRYWRYGCIGQPKPFTSMSIGWENSFGGQGYAENPVGKGIHPVLLADGQTLVPLPNVQSPRQLIGCPKDRPRPCSFGPMDMMWPQRSVKQGTYDNRWLRESWPQLPRDMNYEFFNRAPEDQYLSAYFTGCETIEVVNMHPDHPRILSRLPDARVRCFVTKQLGLEHGKDSGNEVFEEVITHIDTLWLFPEILKGVAIHRGTTKILDDEFADLARIHLAWERAEDAPHSPEFYAEEQRKALDLTVPDLNALPKQAQERLNTAMQRIRSIPRELDRARNKALGKAPVMPRTPVELGGLATGLAKKGAAIMQQNAAMARALSMKLGVAVPFPANKVSAGIAKLDRTVAKINTAAGDLETVRTQGGGVWRRLSDALHTLADKQDPEELKKLGVVVADFLPVPDDAWVRSGFDFVVNCRRHLEQDPKVRAKLLKMGLSQRSIRRAWLGVNPHEIQVEKSIWGLGGSAQSVDFRSQSDVAPLTLPAGLVVPRFHESTLKAIAIYPDWTDRLTRIDIDGSDPTPLFLPAIPNAVDAPVLVVGDDLQARFLEQELGDQCAILVLREPAETADGNKDAAEALRRTRALLCLLPAAAEAPVLRQWREALSGAMPLKLPKGETLFAARDQGVDIRRWVQEALPPPTRTQATEATLETEQKEKTANGLKLPGLNLQGPITNTIADVKSALNNQFADLASQRDAKLATLKNAVSKATTGAGLPAPDLDSNSPLDCAGFAERKLKEVATEREKHQAAGHLTPALEAQMHESEAMLMDVAQRAQKLHDSQMVKLEAIPKKIAAAKAGTPPERMAQGFKRKGMDPSKIVKRSREDVIAMHADGQSLSGAILSGVDLSDLDLRGIDLSLSQCGKTKFSGSVLDGADLEQVIGQEANFAAASLHRATMTRALFSQATFSEAVLDGAILEQTLLKNANLEGVSLFGATLKMALLQGARLIRANMARLHAELSVFSGADATRVNFDSARLKQCLFRKTILDKANFTAAALDATLFSGSHGAQVSFSQANLSGVRMNGQSAFPRANCTATSMHQGCIMETNLTGACFRGSKISESIFERCDLSHADFQRTSLTGTRFNKSNLEQANMRGCNLLLGSLRKARLIRTDFREANLFGVDFHRSVIGGTGFQGANLKRSPLENRTDYLS